MYQNIWVNRNQKNVEVHLWDDEVGYKKFSHKSYAYKKTSAGTYQSFYGDKLKKVNFWTPEDLKDKDYDIDDETYQKLRKRVLDHGNDCAREITDDLSNFDIRLR